MKKTSSSFRYQGVFRWIRVACFVIALCYAVRAPALTWYVATNGNDTTHSGTNGWTNAFLTISNAVSSSSSGDEIWVAAGEYILDATISNPVDKDIHLLGMNGPDATIINGNSNQAMCVLNGCVGGFTITNGFTTGDQFVRGSDDGAGVYLHNAIMTNCIITGNSAFVGGGVAVVSGGVLSNCTVRGNQARAMLVHGKGGGGIYISGGQVRNCRIENNTSINHGGGVYIYANDEIGVLSHSMISNNTAGGNGGGVLSSAGSACLSYLTIYDNTASGDGLYTGGGVSLAQHAHMTNCLIYGNQAPNGCGGGVSFLHKGVIDSCTIVGNTADKGGGISTYWAAAAGWDMFIQNSIIYSNTATTDGFNWYNALNGHAWFTNCCITNATMPPGSALITDCPQFVDFAADNFRLMLNSPCINTGINMDWMAGALDLDGRRRLDRWSRQVDMGAYEFLFRGMMIGVY